MTDTEQSPPGDAEQSRVGRQHIFAVNNSLDLLEIYQLLFQGRDYYVTTTNFVPQTFEQIAAARPSILLIDLAHGERAGWELLERLRGEARTRAIPVVVLSTSKVSLARVQADPARYGGDACIAKPFEIDELLAAVRALIGPA